MFMSSIAYSLLRYSGACVLVWPARCAPVEGLGFGRKGERISTRRSAALAAQRSHGHDVAKKYSVKNIAAHENTSTRHDNRTGPPPPKSWMGISKRQNLIRATNGALHIPVSPLGITGIYDLQSSLTACRASDGGFRIDRQEFLPPRSSAVFPR
jgi:hypothetical protein